MIDISDRDSRGRFIRGNKPKNMRDPVTGQFTKKIVVTDAMKTRYIEVVKDVDAFLEKYGSAY